MFIIVFLLVAPGCKTGGGNGEDPPDPTTYTLAVWLGDGVEGTPAAGEYSYTAGQSASYDFQLETGYFDLTVTLNGEDVSDSGTVTMDKNYTLNASSGSSADLFVSKNGDDNNNGQSEDSAFKTITRAFQAAQPGDTIYAAAGTYNESLTLEYFGGNNAPITLRGASAAAAANGVPAAAETILDGQNSRTWAFWGENCKNLTFENLHIRNYTDVGIGFYLSSQITLRNLMVRNNGAAVVHADWEWEGYGIHMDMCSNIYILSNTAYRNGPPPGGSKEVIMGTGIDTFGCTDSTIKYNLSYENNGGGFLIEDGVNVLFEGNRAFDNNCDASADEWWDAGLWVDGGHDITIRNNIFCGNLGAGIQISDEDFQEPYGYILEDNSSYDNYYGIYIWNFGTNDWPPENKIKRSGNQFYNNTVLDVWILDWE